MSSCPCGSGRELAACCGPILEGAPAPTAEACMRSRYSAYVTGNLDHLRDTLLPSRRGDFDAEGVGRWSREAEWKGLSILATEAGGEGDDAGVVEFKAEYVLNGMPTTHHEVSRFKRVDSRWLYVDGKVRGEEPVRRGPKVGRNEPCPCGSGRKYKKCCG